MKMLLEGKRRVEITRLDKELRINKDKIILSSGEETKKREQLANNQIRLLLAVSRAMLQQISGVLKIMCSPKA